MKILVLNGPNLNKLGQRDVEQYGNETLEEIQQLITEQFSNHSFTFLQSNHEGELIEAIQSAEENKVNGLIANFGGYSHTSVAIRDALELLELPVVEVHLSNVYRRESFRHQAITAAMAKGIIAGFGKNSYILAVQSLEKLAQDNLKR